METDLIADSCGFHGARFILMLERVPGKHRWHQEYLHQMVRVAVNRAMLHTFSGSDQIIGVALGVLM